MYRNIEDRDARVEMAKASCIAGIAFEKSGLGINHSVEMCIRDRAITISSLSHSPRIVPIATEASIPTIPLELGIFTLLTFFTIFPER